MSGQLNPSAMVFVPGMEGERVGPGLGLHLTHPLPAKPVAVKPWYQKSVSAKELLSCDGQQVSAGEEEIAASARVTSAGVTSDTAPTKTTAALTQPPLTINPKSKCASRRKPKKWLSLNLTRPQQQSLSPTPPPSISTSAELKDTKDVDYEQKARQQGKQAAQQEASQELTQVLAHLSGVKCGHSPFTPKTVQDYLLHKAKIAADRNGRRRQTQLAREEAQKHGAVGRCTGGKAFATNHSAVLGLNTIWTPPAWVKEQEKAPWPTHAELSAEGWERQKNGFGRFFPFPRSATVIEPRLWTPEWAKDPEGTSTPVWDGMGLPPVWARMFLPARSDLDELATNNRRGPDEEMIFGRPVEVEVEMEAELLGNELLEMIERAGRWM